MVWHVFSRSVGGACDAMMRSPRTGTSGCRKGFSLDSERDAQWSSPSDHGLWRSGVGEISVEEGENCHFHFTSSLGNFVNIVHFDTRVILNRFHICFLQSSLLPTVVVPFSNYLTCRSRSCRRRSPPLQILQSGHLGEHAFSLSAGQCLIG